MKLFDSTLTLLEKSLDARLTRHTVLSANLANANTPGYVPKDVNFEATLNKMVSEGGSTPVATEPGHFAIDGGSTGSGHADFMSVNTRTTVSEDAGTQPSIDGNRVDADKTAVELAQNGMQYGAAAKAAGKKLAILRYVADGQ